MKVVTLTPADAPRYRAVMLHAYEHAADAFTSTPEERAAEPDAWWLRRIADPAGLTVAFGAFDGEALAGVVALEFSAKPKTRHKALVVGMYVMPAWRGQGISKALMLAAMAHAAARGGITLVQLEVTEGNAPASALYRSLGFQAFGTEPLAVLTPGGYRAKVHMWRAVDHAAGPQPPAQTPLSSLTVRPVNRHDYAQWRPLWDGYNGFYGRHGETALPEHITQVTWQRFFDAGEPVFALVADDQGTLVGLAHALFHRSMTRIEPVCYLSDLFTLPTLRGRGLGRALIEAVCAQAKAVGGQRVYWQTHTTNAPGRLLYDKLAAHQGFIVYAREP